MGMQKIKEDIEKDPFDDPDLEELMEAEKMLTENASEFEEDDVMNYEYAIVDDAEGAEVDEDAEDVDEDAEDVDEDVEDFEADAEDVDEDAEDQFSDEDVEEDFGIDEEAFD